MDLFSTLVEREVQKAQVPTPSAKVPPEMERFQTAQKMQDAYRNGWQPNPFLVRLLGDRM